MARLSRPLDSRAVADADAQIYSRHEDDPRPNPLFDADGQRIPLSPTDPSQTALRVEWADCYREAAASRRDQAGSPTSSAATVPPPLPASDPDRQVDSAVQPCKSCHAISIALRTVPQAAPPAWWRRGIAPLDNEKFAASGACGNSSGTLSGGSVDFYLIPAGSCAVSFPTFYEDIESDLRSIP